MNFDLDDPRLTAFALGELPDTERPEIEKALAERPDLAREVEEIRQTALLLTEKLHDEQAREAVAAPPLKLVSEAPRKARFWRRYPWMTGVAALAVLGFSTSLLTAVVFVNQSRLTSRGVAQRIEPDGDAGERFARAARQPQLFGEPAGRPAEPAPKVVASAPVLARRDGVQPASPAAEAPQLPALAYHDQAQTRGMMGGAQAPGQGDQPMFGGGMGGMMGAGGMQTGPASANQAGQAMMGGFALQPGQRTAGGMPAVAVRNPIARNQPAAAARFRDATPSRREAESRAMSVAESAPPAAVALALKDRDGEFESETLPADSLAVVDAERKLEQAAKRPALDVAAEPAPVVEENPFVPTSREAASTFAIDVDTASYSIVRRSLMEQNRLPSPAEVRIEEMINYFPYQDAPPPAGSPDPFAIHVEAARCPWNAANRLARVGIMGRPIGDEARKPSNLVFLVDVSGSMDQPNKLPLVQWGLQKLVEQLGENDRVAIVVYAGSSGLVLPSTSAMNKPMILSRIEELRAGGSTNGGEGIQLAYDQAAAGFINNGINRVILATDGDFNVGLTDQNDLVRLVESKAKGQKPIFLTVLGFGMDNLKDGTLEKLADKGNGHYAYIDRPEEAHKVLVEEMGATLDVIAKDVKIQVEFNPERVKAYRLIGYENRVMPNQDFRDDRKDGGEIGAGHHVTALYEYVPAEAAPAPPAGGGPSPASFTARLRYKQPEGDAATEIERPVVDRGVDYADASNDFKFASAVAGFGMILRHSPSVGSLTLPGVLELASPTLAHDPSGYRREFLTLVERARDIQTPQLAAPPSP
ncbi:von Willebrand factor type A domain-containing protein [Paludisphaera sp.]|uniref:YfbK domain-containing protein n=1 Tax=Paludisphaera sp. TaxID=2017432 RepID=UPI00301C9A89